MGVQLKRGQREEGLGKIASFLGDSSGQGSASVGSVCSFSPVLGPLEIDLSLAQAFFPLELFRAGFWNSKKPLWCGGICSGR